MPQGLNLIKASAGSGKTFTLARSYIEHLLFKPGSDGKLVLRLERNYHRHLLAITFTNAATDEMKRRIVKELGATELIEKGVLIGYKIEVDVRKRKQPPYLVAADENHDSLIQSANKTI